MGNFLLRGVVLPVVYSAVAVLGMVAGRKVVDKAYEKFGNSKKK